MKLLKYISATLLVAGLAIAPLFAQVQTTGVVRKKKAGEENATEKKSRITDRMQSFFETNEPSDANLEWMRIIYRSLNLNKEPNMPLYYPEEPNEDGMNLFCIIMKLMAENKIPAYEYLDGKELFNDQYRVKVSEMFDRFHILYRNGKGGNEKNPVYVVEDADVPSNEVLSYYIREKYEFDRLTNKMNRRVEAICPVLHRTDEFGGEPIRYPMFWIKMSDLRPFITQQYVFTDNDNNVLKTSLDDYFLSNMYQGDIYKFKNLRNLSLMQMFPDPDDFKAAQDSIENRLKTFDKNLWVPSREELQARAEAEAAAADSADVVLTTRDLKKDTPKKRSVSNKRANRGKAKTTTVKTKKAKVKSSSNNSSSAVRSVRRRK